MWVTVLGYTASASVLATFCMNTMTPLRVVALSSNVLFAAFGGLAHIYSIMILHLILLPVNTVRLLQTRRLLKRMSNTENRELSIEALLPFMSKRTFKRGEFLTRQGERADRMFYLTGGEVLVQEIGKTIGAGSLIGEIGVFAPSRTRMATVVCLIDCETFELTSTKAKQIYHQNPEFGYAVLQMVIARLTENVCLSQQDRHQRRDDGLNDISLNDVSAVRPLSAGSQRVGPSTTYFANSLGQ